MVLLTISGFPSSGKTTRARELAAFFDTKIAASDVPAIKRLKVAVINDESLNLSKTAYDGTFSDCSMPRTDARGQPRR